MNEPWFDPSLYAWLPGTLLGCLGGVWGTLAGVFAPQGKAKTLVFGLWSVIFVASVILLGAGLFALIAGQPYGVWYGLGLAGMIGTCVLGPMFFTVRQRYRQAEARRLEARDL